MPLSTETFDRLVEILSKLQAINVADVHKQKKEELWSEILSERKRLDFEEHSKQQWYYKVNEQV